MKQKRAAQGGAPRGVKLVARRKPTAAERAYGKTLESRARELLSRARHVAKLRKLAISH